MKQVVGIYLAAGRGSRMGCDKLALPLGGMALGSHALFAAIRSPLQKTIVVSREETEVPSWIDPMFSMWPWNQRFQAAYCPSADKGQANSLRCGLKTALRTSPDADAVMVLLSDQPFVTTSMIAQLLAHYSETDAPFVAARRAGDDFPRPPIVIGRSLFPDLFEMKGDEGARRLLRDPSISGRFIDFGDPALFYDVDTKEQYDLIVNTENVSCANCKFIIE
jgi:molybdenum cofactor cytidylyltransferase